MKKITTPIQMTEYFFVMKEEKVVSLIPPFDFETLVFKVAGEFSAFTFIHQNKL